MSYQRERDGFIAKVCGMGWTVDQARSILRMATTAHRLAEAACNGDYPADNGVRKTVLCATCEGGWASASMKKDRTKPKIQHEGESVANWVPMICPDCLNERRIKALVYEVNGIPAGSEMARFGDAIPQWRVQCSGDPRGYVVTLIPPTSRGVDFSSDNIGVPTR